MFLLRADAAYRAAGNAGAAVNADGGIDFPFAVFFRYCAYGAGALAGSAVYAGGSVNFMSHKFLL